MWGGIILKDIRNVHEYIEAHRIANTFINIKWVNKILFLKKLMLILRSLLQISKVVLFCFYNCRKYVKCLNLIPS